MHLCAKNQKKLMMKSRENVKKPVFPAYFRHFPPEKYVSRKSDSTMLWAFLIPSYLCEKKSEKTNDEISRKCQKTGFSSIFPAFSAGKIGFLKIELGHTLGIAILHQCAKFHEKI